MTDSNAYDICPDCGRKFLHKGTMQDHQNTDHGADIALVYCDDMYNSPMGRFRGMKMSHMISSEEAVLHDMAKRIGMRRDWHQVDHYDVALAKREVAIELGAMKITMKQCSHMVMNARAGWPMGTPDHAVKMWETRFADRKAHEIGLSLLSSWWAIAPPAPDMHNARQYCRKINTAQCAAICLSYWPAPADGQRLECPYALRVWGPKVDIQKPKVARVRTKPRV